MSQRLSRPRSNALSAVAVAVGAAASAPALAAPFSWSKAWTYDHLTTGVAGQTSEIASFDAQSKTLWVVGLKGVDVLDARTGKLVEHIDTAGFGEANSVAIKNGVAAVAVAAPLKTDAGAVRFYDTRTRSFTGSVGVGALPDMVTFTPDGGQPEQWPKYANQAACPAAGNGWYYDNDKSPTKILLCPSTCSMVKNTKGQVDVLFGCATQKPS